MGRCVQYSLHCTECDQNRTVFAREYSDLMIVNMTTVCHLSFAMTSQYCMLGHTLVLQI